MLRDPFHCGARGCGATQGGFTRGFNTADRHATAFGSHGRDPRAPGAARGGAGDQARVPLHRAQRRRPREQDDQARVPRRHADAHARRQGVRHPGQTRRRDQARGPTRRRSHPRHRPARHPEPRRRSLRTTGQGTGVGPKQRLLPGGRRAHDPGVPRRRRGGGQRGTHRGRRRAHRRPREETRALRGSHVQDARISHGNVGARTSGGRRVTHRRVRDAAHRAAPRRRASRVDADDARDARATRARGVDARGRRTYGINSAGSRQRRSRGVGVVPRRRVASDRVRPDEIVRG